MVPLGQQTSSRWRDPRVLDQLSSEKVARKLSVGLLDEFIVRVVQQATVRTGNVSTWYDFFCL